MSKKSQAAMEFLMTYGWAILIVIVVIGALAYFGVLSPSMLLPEKCIMAAGLSCVDHVASDNGVAVRLQNSAGRDMIVREVIFSSDAIAGNCSTGPIAGLLKSGEIKSFVALDSSECGLVGSGGGKKKYEVSIEFSWLNSEGLTHVKNGELLSKVEKGADMGYLLSGGEGYGGYGSNFTGYWKFSDGSGTQAADSSSSGNPGTLVNFACTTLDCNPYSGWTSAGKQGNALRFNGINNYVSLPQNSEMRMGGNLNTVAFWIRINGFPDGGNNAADAYASRDGSTQQGTAVQVRASYVNLRLNTVNYAVAGGGSYVGAWTHFALVMNRESSRYTFYRNGVLTNDAAFTPYVPSTTGTPTIGLNAVSGNPRDYLNGTVDEFMIWNRALSAQEVAAIYAGSS